MQAAKQEALKMIDQLPDDADRDEIMYRLYVLDKIRKGQEAVEQNKTLTSEQLNKTLTSEQLKREIDAW